MYHLDTPYPTIIFEDCFIDPSIMDDVIKKKNKTCVQIFYFRSGQNLGGRYYFPRHYEDEKEENILQSFLGQYYSDKIITKLISFFVSFFNL